MKKLMIAAAIVCAAACSQAASIDWEIVNVAPYGGESANDYQVYYLDTAWAAKDSLTGEVILSLIDAGTAQADTYGGIWDGSTLGLADGYSKGETANGYLVVLNNIDPTAADHFYVTEVQTSTANDSGIFTDPASFYFDASTSASAESWQAMAVPEPTSGLLLLIGVAGLALRRRRA